MRDRAGTEGDPVSFKPSQEIYTFYPGAIETLNGFKQEFNKVILF